MKRNDLAGHSFLCEAWRATRTTAGDDPLHLGFVDEGMGSYFFYQRHSGAGRKKSQRRGIILTAQGRYEPWAVKVMVFNRLASREKMKMKLMQKTAVFVVFLLVFPGLLLAKDELPRPTGDLTQSLAVYRDVTMNNDVEGIMSFIYPPIFKLIPKAQLKDMLTKMYESGRAPVIKDIGFQEIGEVQNYAKGQFAVVKYALEIELPRPGDATPQIDKAMIDLMKKQMGNDTQVTIDEKKGVVNIKKASELLAINEDNAGWKVVEKDKLELMEKSDLLPKEILSKLGKAVADKAVTGK